MRKRRRSPRVSGLLIAVAILIVVAYLNQWRYFGTQTRINRLTGDIERRFHYDDGRVEWLPAARSDIPEGAGVLGMLDEKPRAGR